MMRRTLSWVATAALGLLGSTSASALESGFYFGVVGGQTSIDLDEPKADFSDPGLTNFSASSDHSDTGFGLFLGGQFGRWLAVESQFIDLGEYRQDVAFTAVNYFSGAPRNLDFNLRSKFEAAVATLSGIVTLPIGERVAIGLRLGAAVSAAETSYEVVTRRGNSIYSSESDSNDAEASDIDATYGISFEWDPTAHFGFRLEYQRLNNVGAEDDDYDLDEYDDEEEHSGVDVDFISLNLIGRF